MVDFAKIKRETDSFLPPQPSLCKKLLLFLSLKPIFILSRKKKIVPSFTRKDYPFALLQSSFSRKWQSKIKRRQSEKSSLKTEESWYFKPTTYLECSVFLIKFSFFFHLSALYFKQHPLTRMLCFFLSSKCSVSCT